MNTHKLTRMLCLFASILMLTSCSHSSLMDMARKEARHNYMTGHHNRQVFEEELRAIDEISEEYQNRPKANGIPEPFSRGTD